MSFYDLFLGNNDKSSYPLPKTKAENSPRTVYFFKIFYVNSSIFYVNLINIQCINIQFQR